MYWLMGFQSEMKKAFPLILILSLFFLARVAASLPPSPSPSLLPSPSPSLSPSLSYFALSLQHDEYSKTKTVAEQEILASGFSPPLSHRFSFFHFFLCLISLFFTSLLFMFPSSLPACALRSAGDVTPFTVTHHLLMCHTQSTHTELFLLTCSVCFRHLWRGRGAPFPSHHSVYSAGTVQVSCGREEQPCGVGTRRQSLTRTRHRRRPPEGGEGERERSRRERRRKRGRGRGEERGRGGIEVDIDIYMCVCVCVCAPDDVACAIDVDAPNDRSVQHLTTYRQHQRRVLAPEGRKRERERWWVRTGHAVRGDVEDDITAPHCLLDLDTSGKEREETERESGESIQENPFPNGCIDHFLCVLLFSLSGFYGHQNNSECLRRKLSFSLSIAKEDEVGHPPRWYCEYQINGWNLKQWDALWKEGLERRGERERENLHRIQGDGKWGVCQRNHQLHWESTPIKKEKKKKQNRL